MPARLAGTPLGQQNLASLIRSGLFARAATGEANGLFTVVGISADETHSAPPAEYSDLRRAAAVANPGQSDGPSARAGRVELVAGTSPGIVPHGRPRDGGVGHGVLSASRLEDRSGAIPGYLMSPLIH